VDRAIWRGYGIIGLTLLFLLVALPQTAWASRESFWGAQEFYTRKGHLRYLLLRPPHYDPHRTYELWVNLHGSPGCASHAIYQYRLEAQQRDVFLLAPQAPETDGIAYIRPDGRIDRYGFWNMRMDTRAVLTVLEDVQGRYPIDRNRIALLGFSAGCKMGWYLLAARPKLFCFFGGVANGFKHGHPPVSLKALRLAARHVPHFYAAGQADPFAGPMFYGTVRRLRACGFELRTAYPVGVGHDLPPSIKTPLLAFLDTVRARQRREGIRQGENSQALSRSAAHSRQAVFFVAACDLMLSGWAFFRSPLRRRHRAPPIR